MPSHDHDQRLLTLVGCIRGVAFELDGNARYLNAWTDDPSLLARPVSEILGKTIDEVLGHEAGASFTAMVHRVFATGETEHVEYPIEIDGRRRWFFADMKRVGTPPTVVFIARDITERRATEERLARSEERYRLAAQATNDVLWDWDLMTDEVMWNAAKQSVLGYPDDGMTPATWWKDGVHPDDRPHVLASVGAALAGDASAWSGRYRFRRADGSYGSFLDRGFISRDGTGRPLRMVGSMTDVTQIDRLQAQLLHADRMAALGTLAAGVGHEINNPLAYVIGNLDVVLEMLDDATSTELRQPLRDARDGARRIAEIVKSLRTFTRSDDHDRGPVDVHEVLEAAARMADKEIRRRATLVREYGTVPRVRANEAQLGQVFLNLLINAAHAIGEDDRGARICMTTAVDARGRVTVTIRDTGCGIPPEQLARVFDPFFTTKPVGMGTGLGLSICDGIIAKLGGEISVTSELGRGTAFTITLPAIATASVRLPRVLVIDDEVQICRLISRMLDKQAEVITAHRARTGLHHLQREHFDLVLCDVMMPEMTGIELYHELRRTDPAVLRRVYFMTGGAFTQRAEEFLDAIGPARLDKPLERARLLSLLPSDTTERPCEQTADSGTEAVARG